MSTYGVIRHQHTSLQFSDTDRQQRHDVETLFAKGKDFPVKTGTESGPETHSFDVLKEVAKKFNHSLMIYKANWVAVDRKIVRRNSIRKNKVFVVDNSQLYGPGHDRGFPSLSFTHSDERMGRFTIGSFHYSTHGRLPRDPNHDTNRLYAKKIAEWMSRNGSGDKIVLGAGDFNMIDKLPSQDWAFGHAFTSMSDELGKHPSTGYGPIDGFVSWDSDTRVKAKKLQVLDDSRMHLFSDHFVCRGTWRIRHKKI